MFLSSATAVKWIQPSSNDLIKEGNGVTLNVSNNNSSQNITIHIIGPNSNTYHFTNVQGQNYVTKEFTAGSGNYGEYELKANDSSGDWENITNVTIDGADPELDLFSPKQRSYINNSDIEVSYVASDEASGINTTFIQLEYFDGGIIKNSSSESISVADLTEGDYIVRYEVTDKVGHKVSGHWSFTIDKKYEGDKNPEVNIKPGVYKSNQVNPDVRFELNLTNENEPTKILLTCIFNSKRVKTLYKDPSGNLPYSCSLDSSNYRNIDVLLKTEMQDKAGNKVSKEIGEYFFDFSKPIIANLTTPVSIFSNNFNVSYDSKDVMYGKSDLAGVKAVHVQINNGELSFSEGFNTSRKNNVEIPVQGLSSGKHTVYLWAVDKVGRISERESLNFTYMPSAEPKIDLSSPKNLELVSGSFENINVYVENKGKLLIRESVIEGDKKFINNSKTVKSLKPGKKANLTFLVDTKSHDLGVHKLKFKASDLNASTKTNLIIKANKNQTQRINKSFRSLKDKYQRLLNNLTELKSKVNKKNSNKLEEDIKELNNTLNSVEKSFESGKYYKVNSKISEMQSTYSESRKTYKKVRRSRKKAIKTRNMLLGVLSLITLSLAGIGYIKFYSDKYDVRLLEMNYPEVSNIEEIFSGTNLDTKFEEFKNWLHEEEEEIEEEFQGFK